MWPVGTECGQGGGWVLLAATMAFMVIVSGTALWRGLAAGRLPGEGRLV